MAWYHTLINYAIIIGTFIYILVLLKNKIKKANGGKNMGLVQDAFKDAFSGFGGKKDMKQKKEETALDKVERLERELQEERARILNSMPKPPEPPKEDHYQAMSVDSRLDVLEHNINTILTEFNERLTNLERAIIKNIK